MFIVCQPNKCFIIATVFDAKVGTENAFIKTAVSALLLRIPLGLILAARDAQKQFA
ncbi:MAG: hypothetical protein ACJAU1_000646 [Psychromonas sp.]|jgi:hypothetical protein